MTARTGRTILQVAGFVALLIVPSTARAQGNQFNPYGNSGYADYREFGNPMFSSNPALPGQSRIDDQPTISRPRANSFQQYTQELDGTESDASALRRGSSTNMPYYMAYQQLNSRYNRVYRPNDTAADRKFEDRLRQRDVAYMKALEERDPVKRAKLLREVERSSADRANATARSRSTTGTGAAAARPNTIPRAPSPYATTTPSTSRERRIPPAPSPLSDGSAARRPTATAPTNRAPAAAPRTGSDATTAAPRSNVVTPPVTDPSTVPTPAPPR